MLSDLPPQTDPGVLIDFRTSDDAGVYRWPGTGPALVQTVDFFTPIVDDPFTYGQIAAANALSDVYAMGGRPVTALAIAGFPDKVLEPETIRQIFLGGYDKLREAGVALLGGHTVRDPEVKFGLSVTGDVAADQLWTNRTAQPGQVLVLTKALGTGVIGQAIKKGLASEAAAAAAIASMRTLNRGAARIGHMHGVTSATDVTGFGLLGHLRNIVRGSKVGARIELARLPLLPDALMHLQAKVCPAGSKANRAFVAPLVRWAGGAAFAGEPADDSERELLASLACDAQTSGGLLLCVPRETSDALLDELRADGLPAELVGELFDGAGIELT